MPERPGRRFGSNKEKARSRSRSLPIRSLPLSGNESSGRLNESATNVGYIRANGFQLTCRRHAIHMLTCRCHAVHILVRLRSEAVSRLHAQQFSSREMKLNAINQSETADGRLPLAEALARHILNAA